MPLPTLTDTAQGFDLRIEVVYDPHPDISYMGAVLEAPNRWCTSHPNDIPEHGTTVTLPDGWIIRLPFTRSDTGIDGPSVPGNRLGPYFKHYRDNVGLPAPRAYRKAREQVQKYPCGQSRAVRNELWEAECQRMAERLRAFCVGDLSLYGIVVKASRCGVVLGESSLWGIEPEEDYLEEAEAKEMAQEHDLIDEAIAEAIATLDCLNK